MVSMKEYILDLAKENKLIGTDENILSFAKIIIDNQFTHKEMNKLQEKKLNQ